MISTNKKGKFTITFINYDDISYTDREKLEEDVDTDLVVYRGHNYYTSRMIEDLGYRYSCV